MKTQRAANRGMSLIEVVIASIILFVVMAITFGVLFTTTTIANKTSRASDLQSRGREFLQFCRSQFFTGRFRDPQNVINIGLFDGNTQLRFQIPVNRDITGAMQYGYTTKQGFDSTIEAPANDPAGMGKLCVIRFEADTAFQEGTGAPAATQIASTITNYGSNLPLPALPPLTNVVLNADANKDGKLTSTFVRGKVKKYVITPQNAVESASTLDDLVILGWNPNTNLFNGPIDPLAGTAVNPNDTTDGVYRQDWLFRYVDVNGNAVLGPWPTGVPPGIGMAVTVWHGDWDELHKGFLIWRDRETIRFRNPQ